MAEKEIIKEQNKMVDLSDLPKKNRGKKEHIDWINSIGSKVKGIYYDMEFEVEIINYKDGYLYIKYMDKPLFKIYADSFIHCMLGSLLGKKSKDFKINTRTIFKSETRNLIITDRKYREDKDSCNRKYYKYTCNKCGWTEGWIEESHLLQGVGCSCCSSQTLVIGINDIPTTAPHLIKYFQKGIDEAKLYTKGSRSKIYPICPDCGRIKDKPMRISTIYTYHSIGCVCSDKISYGEKIMTSVLEQLRLDFIFQLTKTTFDWCRAYRYDFLIKGHENICIETHGEQHYKQTNRKGARSLEKEQINDECKKQLALTNRIKEDNYIVIDCRKSELEFIKQNILNSRLSNVFDLSNIDWNKVEEFTLSNLVKVACDYKKNNPNMTTTEIGVIMKLDRHTILSYLKKGAELNWCYYDAKTEISNNAKRISKFKYKPISIFKDGIWLKGFDSIMECERQSEELFGVRLCNKNISAVLKGKRKHHRGFTFQYI